MGTATGRFGSLGGGGGSRTRSGRSEDGHGSGGRDGEGKSEAAEDTVGGGSEGAHSLDRAGGRRRCPRCWMKIGQSSFVVRKEHNKFQAPDEV